MHFFETPGILCYGRLQDLVLSSYFPEMTLTSLQFVGKLTHQIQMGSTPSISFPSATYNWQEDQKQILGNLNFDRGQIQVVLELRT